ncbi:MAG TPA: glycosyltransferase [Solirubrobacter sp.]|nr:glycosyltransferase [Solirubrobacter sp.]
MSVTVVVATRDRRRELLASVPRHLALPERPHVIVVDNASAEGTPAALAAAHPEVEVIARERNLGGAARNAGVRAARTPYVAFSDDDSWWAPGALERAVEALEAHPRLALVQARILVGDDDRLDPTCAAMARSPLRPAPGQPGHPLLSFVACGVVVRRDAFLQVGGFPPRLSVGGEEELLGWDLAGAGWQLSYLPDVVSHHHPAAGARGGRDELTVRNGLWSVWLRRPAGVAARRTATALARAARDRATARGVGRALAGLPWVLRARSVSPPHVEAMRRLLEETPLNPISGGAS